MRFKSIPSRFNQNNYCVYILGCYEDVASFTQTLTCYREVSSVRLLITHARTASKLPLSNYSARDPAGNSSRKLQREAHLALVISHRQDRKINRSPGDDGENSGTTVAARGLTSGTVTDTLVVGFRNAGAGRIMLKLSNLTTTSVSSQYFSTLGARPPVDCFFDLC